MTFAIYRTGAQLKLATGNIISRQNSTLATDWTGAQVKLPPEMFKVQLTPEIFFCLHKSFCLFDHRCEKIIVVAIFVNFL